VKNAWGKLINGKWMNSSEEWSKEDREELKVSFVDDGTFWTSLTDFSSI
jgi:hypothetical protein